MKRLFIRSLFIIGMLIAFSSIVVLQMFKDNINARQAIEDIKDNTGTLTGSKIQSTPKPMTTMERLTSCIKREYSDNELVTRSKWNVGDIEVSTPLWITGPMFDNDDTSSGKATFYYKSSGDIYARTVYARNTTTIGKAYVQLRYLVKKQGTAIKFVKKIDKENRCGIEVYRSYVKDNSEEKKAYDYYAIAANKEVKVFIKHDGDIDECIAFVENIYH